MQARRHAAVLAGHRLPADLHLPPEAHSSHGCTRAGGGGGGLGRTPHSPAGHRNDVRLPLTTCPAPGDLVQASRYAGIAPVADCSQQQPTDMELIAALAVERALVIALVCARHQGRYEWAGTLGTAPP